VKLEKRVSLLVDAALKKGTTPFPADCDYFFLSEKDLLKLRKLPTGYF
jgi:hypothetical protein